MSKLTTFKKFYRLDETATRLSTAFGEQVSVSDVLQFVVEERLQISALYLHQPAKVVAPVNYLWNWYGGGDDDPTAMPRVGVLADGLPRVVTGQESLFDLVTHLQGVYRLFMDGPLVASYVQHLLMGNDDEEFSLTAIDGVLVLDEHGTMYELVEPFNWTADEIASKNEMRAKANLPQREKLPFHHKDNYYPCTTLPPIHQLVILTADLLQFEVSVSRAATTPSDETQVHPKRRNSMLRLILGMAIDGYGYDLNATKSPIAAEIANAVSAIGDEYTIDADTVRSYLHEAQGRPKRKYRSDQPK